MPPLVVQVLHNRGLGDPAAAQDFLDGSSCSIHDPFAMLGMEGAVNRLLAASPAREPVVVYGDYDGDGVTATALLVSALRALGFQVEPYIPNRVDEGYGLNPQAVHSLAEQGAKLLVTVDCGTGSVDEVALARSLGMEVIVTDHHHPPGELAPASALLNPRQPGCPYPCKLLAGVGVAYKLLQGLLQRWPRQTSLQAEDLLDLVAIGTVTDVMPLAEENRALVRGGLELMRRGERPGLTGLTRRAGLRIENLEARDLAFALGPRLNAAGRMDDAILAYKLLMAESEAEAQPLADELEAKNAERQRELARVLEDSQAIVAGLDDALEAVVVWGEGWPLGVVGLVAGRLLEEYGRPAFACAINGEGARGSARTPEGYHAVEALERCADLLTRYGGHARAAGFSLDCANLPLLAERLGRAGPETSAFAEPRVCIDAWVRLSAITWDLYRWLQRLGPFGQGNPEPLFGARGVRPTGSRGFGNNHLRLTLSDGRQTLDGVAYRQGEWDEMIRGGEPVDIAFSLADTHFGGYHSLQLIIRDIRPSTLS